jgi:hypothetical protein
MLKTTVGRAITAFRRPTKPTSKVCPVCHTLECLCRVRWFSGQRIDENDLNTEQQYVIKKNRLHNLYLHGWGVVCGLQVVCHDTCSGWVTVEQGYAISPCGDDIIVCEATDFDVLGAIDDCLRRRAQANPMDCTPRAPVRSDCDPDGVWCLTIRYHETASKAVTALVSGQEGGTKACSCGPASTCGGGCGCGCGGNGTSNGHGGGDCHCGGSKTGRKSAASHGSTSVGCGCGCGPNATSSVATGPARPQCEPTRVCEGYVLELCQQDPDTDRPTYGDVLGGTLYGNLYQCFSDVAALMGRSDPQASANARYTALTSLQADVLRFMTTHHTARCDLLDEVRNAGVAAPKPAWAHLNLADAAAAPDALAAYNEAIDTAISTINNALWTLFMDCVCLQLLPPCPTDPGDDRITLACMRVRGGQIVEICNFERKQLITIPALLWWLSALPLGPVVSAALERLCCGGDTRRDVGRLFGGVEGAKLNAGLLGQPADTAEIAAMLANVISTAINRPGPVAQGGNQ